MTETNDTLVVGVDIGGTKVAAGMVDRNGEIKIAFARRWWRTAAAAKHSQRWYLQSICFLRTMRKRETLIRGIGICAPGPLGSEDRSRDQSSKCSVLAQFSPGSGNRESLSRPGEGRERRERRGPRGIALGGRPRLSPHFLRRIGTGIGTGIVFDGKNLQRPNRRRAPKADI